MLTPEYRKLVEEHFGSELWHYVKHKKYKQDNPVINEIMSTLLLLRYLNQDYDIVVGTAIFIAEVEFHHSDIQSHADVLESVINWCRTRFRRYLIFPLRSTKEYRDNIQQIYLSIQE